MYVEPEPEEETQPEEEELTILEGKTVNNASNVANEHGKVFGRITSGDKRLAGSKVRPQGTDLG
jgi:hypothetical protein